LFAAAEVRTLSSVALGGGTKRIAALVTLALGCGDELPPPSYIETTEILTIRHEVEIGPLNPERVGPLIKGAEKPIAEVLPGDRLRLEAIVVDSAGVQVDEDELETLWLQCAVIGCDIRLLRAAFSQRCDQLDEYTTDALCLLGTGSGALEFEVPELGSLVLLETLFDGGHIRPQLRVFGVVAWGGRAVEECWEARSGDLANLDRCGFIFHDVTIGPNWFVYRRAAELGIYLPFNLDPAAFPDLLFSQPANRIPETPSLRVMVDDEQAAVGVPPFPPIPVMAGATIEVAFAFDPLTQLFQSTFRPLSSVTPNAFTVSRERLTSRTATSGAIVQRGSLVVVEDDGSLFYEVDAFAQPGRSRVLIVYRDDRGANDWLSLEFEHP
jgi:hypothetical protein